MKTFLELAAQRYSLRKYSDRVIEPEVMAQVLESGRIAPTAHNDQPQRIKVIASPEELAKVDECTTCRFGAPAVLLVCYDKTKCWVRPFDSALSGEVDASIVATHMMLTAQDLGLGTCWVMYFDEAKTKEQFALPENIIPVAMLPIGYPAEGAKPSKLHSSRLDMAELMI